MSTLNSNPNSPRWAIMQTLLTALQTAPTLAGVRILHNPRGPAALAQGEHLVFLKDQTDTLSDNAGQQQTRSHQFALGAVSHASDADCQADALHEAAASVLRSTAKTTMSNQRAINLLEQATSFDVGTLELDGTLVMSTWVLQYRKAAPTISAG